MPWSEIIAAILKLVGPLLSELLKKWLDDKMQAAADRLGVPRGSASGLAFELLAEVEKSLWFVQWGKKRLVRECRAACVPAIANGRTSLTPTEAGAVKAAAAAA